MRDLLADVPDDPGPAWRYSLLLALTDEDVTVEHVPSVLWSEPSGIDPEREAAELTAVQAELDRRGSADAIVRSELGHSGPIRRIEWPHAEAMPRVSASRASKSPRAT